MIFEKKKQSERQNEKFYYLCIGFSPMTWQQQKDLLSHMMEHQFPNLDALPKYATHLLQKANVELYNLGQIPNASRCFHVWTLVMI